jgi:hypothetical protein
LSEDLADSAVDVGICGSQFLELSPVLNGIAHHVEQLRHALAGRAENGLDIFLDVVGGALAEDFAHISVGC